MCYNLVYKVFNLIIEDEGLCGLMGVCVFIFLIEWCGQVTQEAVNGGPTAFNYLLRCHMYYLHVQWYVTVLVA
jgi:hypothetical protein